MSIRKCDYKVFLYKNDYIAMCNEVFRHQSIETGGNLFGLWTTSGNVVVHVVLGPGKNCRRTSTSFHQDIKYMERVGRFLNKTFMLCHIGEWHSHHRLSLAEPSCGDKETVKRNYPEGMKRFLVIIANIVARDEDPVVLSPYFFTNDGNTCEKGEFIVLDADSPFTSVLSISSKIKDGAEDLSSQPMPSLVVNSDQSFSRNQPKESGSPNRQSNKNSSRTLAADNPSDKSSDNSTRMDIDIPVPDYEDGPSYSHTNTRYPSVTQTMVTRSNLRDTQMQTRQENILQKVHQEVQSKFCCSEVLIKRNTVSGDIDMKFKHNGKFWLIWFPHDFPVKPAKILRSYIENRSYVGVSPLRDPGSLNNHIAILLVIKTECDSSSCCALCRRITAEYLARSDPTLSLFLTEEGNDVLKELWDRVKSTIADPGTLQKNLKHITRGYLENDLFIEVSFKHCSKMWLVKLTSLFPVCPAKVSRMEGSFGMSEKSVSSRNSIMKLDQAISILSVISQHCHCKKCQSLKFS